MPDSRLITIISKIGAWWTISEQDQGRELFVVPTGKKAFETIAAAIEKEYIRKEDAPKYCAAKEAIAKIRKRDYFDFSNSKYYDSTSSNWNV